MTESEPQGKFPRFNRKAHISGESFLVIGSGSIGGKAAGLLLLKNKVLSKIPEGTFFRLNVDIPQMAVIATDYFDLFMKQNDLYEVACSDKSNETIAYYFQKAALPATLVGHLRSIITRVHTPLAIRSSSMLEDAMFEPFAGIYGTKMIPNNQGTTQKRFHKLCEAIKFVYASTFFQEAKNYIGATSHSIENEKMAVIIQEVVGKRHEDCFYPNISGVGRSYNFYPTGRAKPEHGVIDLALGLGKAIVDGGFCWTYSPAFPRSKPPYGSPKEMIKFSQTDFWAVNMLKPTVYDPVHETEYMKKFGLSVADRHDVLRQIVSTYDVQSDRINLGYDGPGPKILDFSPLLDVEVIPLNNCIKKVLSLCEEAVGHKVEIEFAITFDNDLKEPARFGLLQARPMVVSEENVSIEINELSGESVIAASENVMGNGIIDTVEDIVFVKPDVFDAKYTPKIASELEIINKQLVSEKRRYLLMGFGRWGSSDSWLGIPVNWGQISGARVLVEATLPNMYVDLSQGSHFFHNLTSFQVGYFAIQHSGPYSIDWDWLMSREYEQDLTFTRYIKLDKPLGIKLDGRNGRGVIRHD